MNPRKKFGVMVCGCISYDGMGTLAFVKGNLNAPGYQDKFEKNLWLVAAKYFPSEDFIFQNDNALNAPAFHRGGGFTVE